jgi:hypothetical protein
VAVAARRNHAVEEVGAGDRAHDDFLHAAIEVADFLATGVIEGHQLGHIRLGRGTTIGTGGQIARDLLGAGTFLGSFAGITDEDAVTAG